MMLSSRFHCNVVVTVHRNLPKGSLDPEIKSATVFALDKKIADFSGKYGHADEMKSKLEMLGNSHKYPPSKSTPKVAKWQAEMESETNRKAFFALAVILVLIFLSSFWW